MRAMILAAGRGRRMMPLTKDKPKSLLTVHDHSLIEHQINALARAGITDIVINVAYLGEQIVAALGDGSRYGVKLFYSIEIPDLETGGGIVNVLPLLGADGPFLVVSADIFTDFPYHTLPQQLDGLAHLVMVDNPSYHSAGDFYLQDNRLALQGEQSLTFANIGVYHPKLFANCKSDRFRLGAVLKEAVALGKVTGEHHAGCWFNLGTPQDLEQCRCQTRNIDVV